MAAGGARGRSAAGLPARTARPAGNTATHMPRGHATRTAPRHTAHGSRESAHAHVTVNCHRHIDIPRAWHPRRDCRQPHQQKACTVVREHNHLPAHPTTRRGSRAVVYEKAVTTPEGRSAPYRRVTRASASSKTRDPRLPITGHKSIGSGTQALGAEGYRGRRGRTTTTHASSSDAMARVTLERRLHAARSFESASSGAGLPSVSAACSVAI